MGTLFRFECSDCEYTATVSGGRDVGMMAVTKTTTCTTCKELVDVMVGQFGEDGPTGDPEFDKQLGICPECEGSEVRPWGRSHRCPKCSGKMIKDDCSEILWD